MFGNLKMNAILLRISIVMNLCHVVNFFHGFIGDFEEIKKCKSKLVLGKLNRI